MNCNKTTRTPLNKNKPTIGKRTKTLSLCRRSVCWYQVLQLQRPYVRFTVGLPTLSQEHGFLLGFRDAVIMNQREAALLHDCLFPSRERTTTKHHHSRSNTLVSPTSGTYGTDRRQRARHSNEFRQVGYRIPDKRRKINKFGS